MIYISIQEAKTRLFFIRIKWSMKYISVLKISSVIEEQIKFYYHHVYFEG